MIAGSIYGCLALALIALAVWPITVAGQDRREPTIQTHTGPWYEPGAAAVDSLWHRGDPGIPLSLRGRVRDANARPVDGALVEYWHTDAHGSYPPLRASTRTRADGRFDIRTVLPGHNQGYRARHIHFVLSHPGHPRLVTRIYFRGDENIDEAPWPELAIILEKAVVAGSTRMFGNVEFVLDRSADR